MATKQQEIEARYGQPLADVLMELYKKHGNVRAVAEELGVTQSMVSYYVRDCGLMFVTSLVDRTTFRLTAKGQAILRDMRVPSDPEGENVPHYAGVSQ